nr:MAG TPA: hypothetical protein [Caudoviricetes sp.]
MVPRRPPRPCCWIAPPGGGCRADPVLDLQPLSVGSIETPPGWHGLRSAALSDMDP